MTRIAKRTALTLLTIAIGACGVAGGVATAEDADRLAAEVVHSGGKADDPRLVEAALGGSYSFELRRKAPGAETTARHVRVLRFTLEAGETVGAVLRRIDGGDLEAFIALYVDGERTLTSRGGQGLLPMARERDGALVFTAPRRLELLLFVAGRRARGRRGRPGRPGSPRRAHPPRPLADQPGDPRLRRGAPRASGSARLVFRLRRALRGRGRPARG